MDAEINEGRRCSEAKVASLDVFLSSCVSVRVGWMETDKCVTAEALRRV